MRLEGNIGLLNDDGLEFGAWMVGMGRDLPIGWTFIRITNVCGSRVSRLYLIVEGEAFIN